MTMKVPTKVKGFTYKQAEAPSAPLTQGDSWFDTVLKYGRVWDSSLSIWKTIIDGKGFGYVIGGYGANLISFMQRIEFPFNSGTAIFISNLYESRYASAGCNSSNYGFTLGGSVGIGASNLRSCIDRLLFPFDSGNVGHVGNLTVSRRYSTGCNSSQHGFCMGGYNGVAYISSIERILFPFNSGTSSNVGNLSISSFVSSSVNCSTYGYNIGGTGPSTVHSTINRITFPFNSGTASHTGNLNLSKYGSSGCNSEYYGFSAGGYTTSWSSTIERFQFPFDSGISNTIGNLSANRYHPIGINSTLYGYVAGGYNNESVALISIDFITFPFDSGNGTNIGNLNNSSYGLNGVDTTDFNGLFN